MRRAAEAADRDPASVEITLSSYCVDPEPAVDEVLALARLGATRVVIPAALFQPDPRTSLRRFGEQVIGQL